MTKKRNMDNETAKAFLIQALDQYLYNTNEQCKEAFAIAIKALEREETCYNASGKYGYFRCSACSAYVGEDDFVLMSNCEASDFKFCPACGRKVEETE